MGKRKYFALIVFLLVVVAVISYCMVIRVTMSEEERVRNVIREGERAFEACSTSRFMRIISQNYRDEYFDYAGLKTATARIFISYGSLSVRIRGLKIEVSEPQAVATMVVDISGVPAFGGDPGIFSREGDTRQMKVYFCREDGEWKVLRAEGYRDTGR